MERLVEKYIKYFYITLVSIILMQLIVVVVAVLTSGLQYDTFMFMFFSVTNILLLIDSIKHNIKQQFTECKMDAKILRFTIGLLMISHMVLYFKDTLNLIVLMDHIMITATTIVILNYRIKTIEYLENLVCHFTEDKVLDRKEE